MTFFPQALTRIHQIEVTSRCNLACVYCPHPKMTRKKEDMDMETFKLALDWVRYFKGKGTQTELALTGIGEAIMHPNFVEMVALARDAMGDGFLNFSTNGILLTDELCRLLEPYHPAIYVSMHRPEIAAPAIETAKRHGLFLASNSSFVTSSLDWAGQVDWYVSAPPAPCKYLSEGWGVVFVDGHITTCCIDAEGDGIVGHVTDALGSVSVNPYSLCEPCSLIVSDIEDRRVAS